MSAGAMYIRKIRCPRHYMLRPGGTPFVMERIPSLKNIKEGDARRLGITLWRPKKDRFGEKIQNFKDYLQPEVSASEIRERIYSSTHPICATCRRCVTQ
jgi:hypothetical protein